MVQSHQPPFSIAVVEGDDGAPIAIVQGELDIATAPLLARELGTVAREGPRRLVIDLAGTTFMDCGGARAIIDARRALPPGSCEVVLRSPRPRVRMVLELIGLDGTCVIEHDGGPASPTAG
ncbi:MAG: STAS domain-containing protein [Acidimicrobiales bacterium]